MVYHEWQTYFRKSLRIMFSLSLLLYFPPVNSAYTTNAYACLWGGVNNAPGNVNYTGPALGYIRWSVDSLYTGEMQAIHVDCSSPDNVMVFYKAEDR